jgi:hypothetical protein
LVAKTHVPNAVYDQARQHFSETELVNLTLCVAAINAWNRIVISFRAVHPVDRTAPQAQFQLRAAAVGTHAAISRYWGRVN